MIIKAKDPFGKYREDKVNNRLEFIRQAITDLKSGQFTTASQTAIYLAKLLTRHEQQQYEIKKSNDGNEWIRPKPKSVAKATLLRSPVYRPEIDAYLIGIKLGAKEIVKPANLGQAEFKIRSLEVKVSNLENENDRLQSYINHKEKQSNENLLQHSSDDSTEQLIEARHQSEKLSTAIGNLYWYLEDFLDIRDGCIFDFGLYKKIVDNGLIESCHDLFFSKSNKQRNKDV